MKSKFMKDLRERRPAIACSLAALILTGLCWILFGRQPATTFAWGMIWGLGLWLICQTAEDKLVEKERKHNPQMIVSMDIGADGRSATVISERQSDGSLMIIDSFDHPPADLEALLEQMMDEPAISAAKSAYASVKKAADDPWDDTGWDEPWAAAIEAAFEWGLEELREKGE
jgi:hypothetical protein